MARRKTYMGNLFIANHSNRHGTFNDGCFVECGTWRGRTSFGLTEVLSDIREYHYFDSFEGLPPAGEWDGDKARTEQPTGTLWHNNNTADYDDFLEGMKTLQKPDRTLSAHKGWFEDTLPQFEPERAISVLRLDGDWYDSTVCILDNLFDRVMQGGLIMIDDYYD
jgi:O-methyltransferase